ncbi:MAG: 23S rRNA (uracil(1939)-C(5))-methyltransferase RlmD [Clostridium sp.]|uniref:23S rRNA (uracil(1939)-C(5))-methyltransferase RlmD n=1 Tax=Clostridium sp. TaxID=1506 RepID=UPI0025C1BAE1|nr:23S rRNA (uracil(1939)-C(5))-methyltransferase RlmD [Clostridium sp.]MCH3965892.1 23S rRNA (uracil(1939)-C(5))-methyltransferase RlmD [Clostridium sp.]MCI1716019.1 23S rRNA (uracil(1939)-C(5))-methyltransferase RlmD [Clostridium sp.]MCI1800309.1 23S rRNA (uracil(1939)-C(5))-methyltransferase RlmD [Clostridium sp.]MCI1814196.1 23S rRNA (uracil(1939)-C(5))-methyltransferase RlmD [Clostridium sp.]MCI1871095.1 23S rRNA (uracil(1939)-C(5))-methyltransferase RlmD [Clostridium sp.]
MKNLVEKNKEYIINIDNMGYDGSGVGRINGFTIFVEGALTGEKVRIKVVKVKSNFAFGKVLEIIESSKYRREPVCSIYKRCGGCQLQHISYEGQLKFKKKRVEDSLERIGKLDLTDVKIHDTIGMKVPYRYRNKVQLPVERSRGEINIGFYVRRTHDIINMDCCYIQNETADKVAELFRQWLASYNVSCYDESAKKEGIRHIVIRKAFSTGEVMIIIVTSSADILHKDELIKSMCQNINGLKSIIQNINSSKTNVVLGKENITLWGSDTINDYIGNFRFSISPLAFFQVNPVQTEALYNKVLEYAELKGNETVFDAYCGTGTISLFLSCRAKKVYGVEVVEQAIENAKKNALDNKVDNVEFIVGKSEAVIPDLVDSGIKADVVVVDPPRKGCDRTLLASIAKMCPGKIVYVSCDPGTLARDLGIMEELGYRTVEVQTVDMFCQTAPVECVVKLVASELS